MKKILYIASIDIFPPNTSGAKVIYGFINSLEENIYPIILTVKSDDEESKSKIKRGIIIDRLNKNSLAKFLSPFSLLTIISIIIKYKPESLIIEFPWFGIYGILIKILFNIPYSIKEQNVEFLRFKRFGKPWWRILRVYEKLVYSFASKIYVISISDKKIFQKEFGIKEKRMIYLPYIPDKTIFKKNSGMKKYIRKVHGLDQSNPLVLFFGPMDYKPNKLAVEVIVNEIAPLILSKRPEIKFIIVGRNPPKIKAKNIIFTGFVKNIEDYINGCDIVIVPLIIGGGIRTKILESLACDKKVISTKIGAEGIAKNKNLIIIKNWEDMVHNIDFQLS